MHSDNISTTVETRDRKTTKPIMEKRRRARINASLSELKSLLLEAIKKEGARHSKMEKADILEMTVKHLRQMQRQHFTVAAAEDPTVLDKYRHGFNECALEVKRYLASLDSCDVEVKTSLLNHIAKCVTGIEDADTQSRVSVTTPLSSLSPEKTEEMNIARSRSSPTDGAQVPPISIDANNNVCTMTSLEPVKSSNVFSGLQVIPTQLPSGEIAFVLPTNIIRTNQVPSYVIPVYAGSSPLPTANPVRSTPVSTLSTQITTSAVSNQCPSLQKISSASENCDKSYLPCATVNPVKPIPSLPSSDYIFVEEKHNGLDLITGHSRHEANDASHEGAVWRPW